MERERGIQSVHILVVDDNTMNQDLMANILAYWGFSFVIVSNGKEAVERVGQGHFDLVLMDIQMPEMDGYSATIHIRTVLKSAIPIVAMTAHAMTGEREKCIHLGMNDYISKPVNEQELLELIDKLTVSDHKPAAVLPTYNYLNLDYLKDMGKGNIAYERKVTGYFIQRVPDDMLSLHAALKMGEYGVIARVAHSLRTTLAIMGVLSRTVHILDALEFPEQDKKEFGLLIAALDMICSEAVAEALSFLKSLKE
jgi:CheY-like chemotaxis protein